MIVTRGRDDVWYDENSDPYTTDYVVEVCKRDPSREKDFVHYPDHKTYGELKRLLNLG